MLKRTSPGVGIYCRQNASHRSRELCTLAGGFARDDGRLSATIQGTHRPDKMIRIDWTPGHPVGDAAVIWLPCDDLGQAHQASIPYV